MDKLYDLIILVSKRPEMYIGNRSLDRLYAFIGGFLTGNPQADDHCLDGFNDFVLERYDLNLTINWSTCLQLLHQSEHVAFARFMELFMEFQNIRKTDDKGQGDGFA